MLPCLYEADELSFSSLGLGGLHDAQQIRVIGGVNAPPELEMRYPVRGRRFADLQLRRIITATTGAGGGRQPFRIYRITKPLDGTCTVYARHLVYDLMGYTVDPFSAQSPSGAAHKLTNGATADHDFNITVEITSSTPLKVDTPRSVWSMLGGQKGSLLDVYGGEWEFDFRSAVLRDRIGADNGVAVRYGVNLKSCEQDENLANCWTAVHPFWHNPTDGTTVTLPEHILSAGTFDYTRILALDLSSEFETAPTQDQLRSRAQQYISSNQIGVPAVGLDVDFVPLSQTEEYKDKTQLQQLSLGDTVTVYFPSAYDLDTGRASIMTAATARVVETVWLPLENRYEHIRIGEKRANFVSAVATVQKKTEWLMTRVR